MHNKYRAILQSEWLWLTAIIAHNNLFSSAALHLTMEIHVQHGCDLIKAHIAGLILQLGRQRFNGSYRR
jgi:hypothetical protein